MATIKISIDISEDAIMGLVHTTRNIRKGEPDAIAHDILHQAITSFLNHSPTVDSKQIRESLKISFH